MILASVLFALAAVFGVALALIRFQGKELPPLALALVHGGMAASGLIALGISVLTTISSPFAVGALVGFLVAALGGFLLFSFHWRRKALPIPLVAIHGLVAVASFIVLVIGFLPSAA